MHRSTAVAVIAVFAAAAAVAQHEGHSMPGMEMEANPPERNLFSSDMRAMTGRTPVDAMPEMGGPAWHVMDLGVLSLTWNDQRGPSGDSSFESANWNMLHAGRALGPGRISLMMMNSLEPATYPARGSPELFQTGESYHGEPLVDRQHPHDFFMNLSATYRASLSADSAVWGQLAPVGEPACGPIAFMHRASAGDNPAAPLGHHWQDSTHISFNVVTLGGGWRWLSLEGSVFRGREPDEHRWDIDGGRIDSAAGRASFDFGGGWSADVSYAFIKSPEALEPGDTHRSVVAVYYGARGDRPLAATLLWGRNDESFGASDSILLEGAWQITPRDQAYMRAERVEKDLLLLATKRLPSEPGVLARITAGTFGYSRTLTTFPAWRIGIGGDLTFYSFPSSLRAAYGSSPVSSHVFLRVRWGAPHAGAHPDHGPMKMGG